MNNDLIARYIYAVTRHLPQKMRDDVERELDGLISDMLDERCGDTPPTDKDVKIVMLELGTPDELASKYSDDDKKYLISGVYYITYKRVLKLVLPIVAGAVALGVFISVLSNAPESFPLLMFGLFARVIGGAIGGVWQAFAVITLIFAILERTKTDLSGSDPFSSLPPVPKQVERIKPHEPIVGIVWSIIATIVFLGFPQVLGFWYNGGPWLPVLDVVVIRGLWLPIVLWTVFEIAKESVKLVEGRYTKRLVIVNTAANILIVGIAAFVFLNNAIVNPDFLSFINSGALFGSEGDEFVAGIISSFNVLFFGVICFALIIDTITVSVRAWKYTRA